MQKTIGNDGSGAICGSSNVDASNNYTSTGAHTCENIAVGVNETVATCLYGGVTEHRYCLVCDKVISDTKKVTEPKGHTFKEATCVSPKTCINCGTTEGDIATEHASFDANGICTLCEYSPDSNKPIVDANGVYKISTVGELVWFGQYVNSGNPDANAVLLDDIDLAGYNWKTICETDLYYNGYGEDLGYTGTFDGNGHVIKNIKAKSSTTRDASCGIFGTVSGTVKNLGVDGFEFIDGGKDILTGAIVGQLITANGKVSNCYVLNAIITPGEHVTGGISGCVYDGTIENCYVVESTINGTANRFGYIVGDSRGDVNETDRPGTVVNCYTDATPEYSSRTGNITNCEVKSLEQFESGEVTYLLNGSVSGGTIYGRWIRIETYPVLGGDMVYYSYEDCYATEKTYSNYERTIQGHFGGTATCITSARCYYCGNEYGPLDRNNHVGGYYYQDNFTEEHDKMWACCGAHTKEREPHNFVCTETNGVMNKKCSDCGQSFAMNVTLSETDLVYDGTVKTPTVSITDDIEYVFVEGVDFTVEYPESKDLGTYEATITFKGRHSGTKTFSYNIVAVPVSSCDVSIQSSIVYNARVQAPKVSVKGADGTVLAEGVDYTVSYPESKNVGTYTATVTMKGNYTGTKTLSYNIVPLSINNCTVTLSTTNYTYNGKEKKPAVTVKRADGKILTNGNHYSVTYSSGRTKIGTYTVTVKMINSNYTGTKTLAYKINPISINTCKIKLSKTSYTCNNTVHTPSVIVKNSSGKTLKRDTDYKVSYSGGRKNAGTYYVTVTMKGCYSGTKKLSFKINPINISTCKVKLSTTSYTYNGGRKTPGVTVKNSSGKTLTNGTHYKVKYADGRVNAGTYKVTVTMIGNYTGTRTLSFKINPVNISTCKLSLSKTTYTYDGKVKTPSVTVKNSKGAALSKGVNFTYANATNGKSIGKHTVIVKMKGNYTGSKRLSFVFNPPKTTINKLTAGKKSISVKINNVKSISGYEIAYSTKKDFSGKKTVTNSASKSELEKATKTVKLTGLKAGKTYYVKVRTYKKVDGVKYYSGWSTYVKAKAK